MVVYGGEGSMVACVEGGGYWGRQPLYVRPSLLLG